MIYALIFSVLRSANLKKDWSMFSLELIDMVSHYGHTIQSPFQ